MAIESWLAFASVSLVLLACPGPITLLAASYGLTVGRARGAALIPGVVLGDLAAMSASLLGVGMLAARSPVLLGGLNLLGGCMLLGMGVRVILLARGRRDGTADERGPASARQAFGTGFALAALHPGGFIFFTSFVPQFVEAGRPFAPQAVVLVVTFLAIGALTTASWLLAADRMRRLFRDPRRLRAARQLSGALMVAMGAVAIARAA